MTNDRRANDWPSENILLRISEEWTGNTVELVFEILGGVAFGKVLRRQIDPEALEKKLKQLRALYEDAGCSDPHEHSQSRRECVQEIKQLVAPEKGVLATAYRPGEKPKRLLLRVSGGLATRVPWEALEHRWWTCRSCWQHYLNRRECIDCGGPLIVGDLPVSAAPGVVHLPSESGSTGAHGAEFLVLIDPAGDVFKESEKDKASAVQRAHDDLTAALSSMGYQFKVGEAIVAPYAKNVLEQLSNPRIVGIYYFGHADADAGGAYLKLGDEKLHASEIRARAPFASFVFLNACEAAGHVDSLVEAFSSMHSVSIGPATRVNTVEGAEFAADFFRELAAREPGERSVSAAWQMLSRKLDQPSVQSQLGIYRIFGCKTAQIPVPVPEKTIALFDGTGEQEVLRDKVLSDTLRSAFIAARRASHAKVGVAELICALEEKGNLTRHILNELVLSTGSDLRSLPPETWLRTTRSELDHELVKCLVAAAVEAAKNPEQIVSEKDVLHQLVRYWSEDVDLQHVVLENSLRNAVDAPAWPVDLNGNIDLRGLTSDARQLVLAAYDKWCEITALGLYEQFVAVAERGGCAGARNRIIPNVAAPNRTESKRVSIPRNRDRGILIPMLLAANERRSKQIDVHRWFTLFCRTASRGTRLAVEHKWGADLSALGCTCHGARTGLDDLELDSASLTRIRSWDISAQEVIQRFHSLTRETKSCSNRLLVASFFDQDKKQTADFLQRIPEVDRKAFSEQLIETSSIDDGAWTSKHQKLWQSRVSALIEKAPAKVTSTTLLGHFGRTLPARFREGLKIKLLERWPELPLGWLVDQK